MIAPTAETRRYDAKNMTHNMMRISFDLDSESRLDTGLFISTCAVDMVMSRSKPFGDKQSLSAYLRKSSKIFYYIRLF